MVKEKTNNQLNMNVINGVVLAIIGILVMITPLATEIAPEMVKIDLIAGGALFAGGVASILWGLKSRK